MVRDGNWFPADNLTDFLVDIIQEENEARELGLLYTVPSGGMMNQPAGPQGPTGQESPPRSMSDRSGSGGSKSANKGESGCDSSGNNGYENKRLTYPNREAGQHPAGPLSAVCPTGNSDESSHYHAFINRKSDGLLGSGEPLSPRANGGSKLSNNSLSPKSPQMMDSDSDDVGDSDHNSHPAGNHLFSIDSKIVKFPSYCERFLKTPI